ncbi:MAG TPA: hypothetical protein VFP79_09685, partial [Pseudolabrys sp.]|nr:hypothetical protein [Pseudolabrys sp.]
PGSSYPSGDDQLLKARAFHQARAERPRSSSITATEANPHDRADSARAYYRRWLSVCSATWPKVDWRI